VTTSTATDASATPGAGIGPRTTAATAPTPDVEDRAPAPISTQERAQGPGRVRAEDRRRGLLACAVDLLHEGGAPAVTMDAVAERSGVSRTLVYKHFANRDELLAGLWRREAAAVDRAVSEALVDVDDFESIVRISLEAVIDAVARHGSLGVPLVRGELFGPEVRREQQERRRRVRAWYVDRICDGFRLGPAEADIAASVFFAGLDGMLADWRADPARVDRRTLVDTYVRLVVGGLHALTPTP
jgi:AcrR family transcriptional regulator